MDYREKRRHARLRHAATASYRGVEFPENLGSEKTAGVRNISHSGMLMNTDERIETGKYLRVSVQLERVGWQKAGANVSFVGQVKYSLPLAPDKFETGLTILSIGGADMRLLERYLARRAS